MNKSDQMFRQYPWIKWLFRRAYAASWRYSIFAFNLNWDAIKKPKFERIDEGLMSSGVSSGSHSYKSYPEQNSTTRTTDVYSTFVVYDIAGFLVSRRIRSLPWSHETIRDRLRNWEILRVHAIVEVAVSYNRSGIFSFSHDVNTTIRIPPNDGMDSFLKA